MNNQKYLKSSITGIVILGVLLGVIACRHSVFNYTGKVVKPENRILLKQGGPHKSVWNTEDLTLSYEYQKQGGTLEISGKIAFANHLVYNFRDFSNFILTVYFADANGRINGEQALASASVGKAIRTMSFDRRMTLPPGAENMVFGYRGRAVDRSSSDGSFGLNGSIDWEFWTTPTR